MSSAAVIHFPRERTRQTPRQTARPDRVAVQPRHENDRAELISALLLEIERSPTGPLCYPARDIGGVGQVQVVVGLAAFNLTPGDCHYAADTLLAERGDEPGVWGIAADLREAAAVAEARRPHGGPLNPAARPRWGTGMATTTFLGGLIGITVCLCLAAGALVR